MSSNSRSSRCIPRASSGGTSHSHSMAAAPMTYSDHIRSARRNRLSTPQHTATEASMAVMSSATSCLAAGATSPRRVGKGLGEAVSTGWPGSRTRVWHRGQKDAVASSSTPQ